MSLTISLTPEQVEQLLARLGIPCRFSDEERIQYATTPVVNQSGRLFGFPTPAENASLTLSNIKKILGTDPAQQPAFFEHPWCADEVFMTTPCSPGWHILYTDVITESVNQPVDYVRRLIPLGLELPSAVEVILMLFLHYAQTTEQLLLRKHTWCCDTASLGRQVTVGAFGRNGVFLSGHPGSFASRGLGICGRVHLDGSGRKV